MREILFRGKRVDNGEWVYGFYGEFHNRPIHDAPNSCQIFEPREDAYLCGSAIGGIWHEVIPSTIGQYTGLIDKNGKRIFEGDIVSFNGIKLKISFKNSEFCVEHLEGEAWTYPYLGANAKYMEVVGNINDNPDMLTDNGEG